MHSAIGRHVRLMQMHGQDDEITPILATWRRRCTLVPHTPPNDIASMFDNFVNRIYIFFFANGKNANVGLSRFRRKPRTESPMRFSPFLRSRRRQQRPNCTCEHRRSLHKPPCHESMTWGPSFTQSGSPYHSSNEFTVYHTCDSI